MKKIGGFSGQRAIRIPKMVADSLETNPITNSLYLINIGYFPSAKFHYRERSTALKEHVLIYLVKGSGWFRVGSVIKHVRENQYFILPAGRPHAYGSDENNPWTIYWIYFKGTLAEHFVDSPNNYPINIKPGAESRIEYRNKLFETIYYTLERGYSKQHLEYASLCLLYYMSSFCYLQIYRDTNPDEDVASDYTSLAIHFMRENIERKLKVEDIASGVGISAPHLSMVFQESTGQSPINYLMGLRIQLACQYLDFTEMRINQVCHRVGYEDAYYFTRTFTKIMGQSPKEYRKRERIEAKTGTR